MGCMKLPSDTRAEFKLAAGYKNSGFKAEHERYNCGSYQNAGDVDATNL